MVEGLRAIDFRCWRELSLAAPAQGVFITGDNAMGKTSILEALCVLLRLHSPRTNKMSHMIRQSSQGYGIAGEAWGMNRKVKYSTNLTLECDGESRSSAQDYLSDGGLIVWMGNEDMELIRGPGELRRKYLDFMGSQWDLNYRRELVRYKRAVKAKNLLLKELRPDHAQIQAYEEVMIASGSEIMRVRLEMLEKLRLAVHEAHTQVGGRKEQISIQYVSSSGEDLRAAMEQAAERELRTRQSVVGPHRDDLMLQINSLSAAEFASEGQQRTLALALKLAQGVLLENQRQLLPVYLLDDIFGELDAGRRNAVIECLPQRAQKWITTTNLSWRTGHGSLGDMHHIRIADGKLFQE